MSSIPMPRRALGERSTNNMKTKLPMKSQLPTFSKLAPPVSRKRKSERLTSAPMKKIRLETQRPTAVRAQAVKPVKTARRLAAAPARPAAAPARPATHRPAAPPVSRRKPQKAASGADTRQPAAATTRSKPKARIESKKPTGMKSKKPGWDLRGQINDLKEALEEKENVLSSLAESSDAHQQQAEAYQTLISDLEARVGATDDRLECKTAECASHLQRTIAFEGELSRTKVRRERLEANVAAHMRTISQQGSTIAHQTTTIGALTAAKEQLSAEVSAQKITIETKTAIITDRDREIIELKAKIGHMTKEIVDRDCKLIGAEEKRKVLHNQIQELKGNIRVFCRVRPLLEGEQEGEDEFISIDGEEKLLELTNLKDRSLNKTSKKLDFSFDHVFGPGSSQSEIFGEISQLVQSALDGYNVCIFAYGQTGSGKTFTMEGPVNADDHSVGMIPRSVTQVFLAAQSLQDKGWEFDMEACFVEIYNDSIHDLLGNGGSKKPEIRMLGKNSREVEVTNVVRYSVTSEGQVVDLLVKAAKNRAVASTAYNERSSRSHSVFRLKITGTNKVTGDSSQGTLNLVDLAGSERLPEAGYEKERLKEMKKINQSLSNLGQVIKALAAKESHVPFRNCKLTHMLQDSLGGNSKTLMFVNVSPKEDCFQETLCSLRFAVMVNNCNIGTAQKRVK